MIVADLYAELNMICRVVFHEKREDLPNMFRAAPVGDCVAEPNHAVAPRRKPEDFFTQYHNWPWRSGFLSSPGGHNSFYKNASVIDMQTAVLQCSLWGGDKFSAMEFSPVCRELQRYWE